MGALEHNPCEKHVSIVMTVKFTFCMVLSVYACFRYLLEQDYPGGRIGPEPTTDCFTAIMHGDVPGVIPGNALVVDPNKPFRKLNPFGNTFLNR